jgi:N-acyl homoserine lactone hydrolase
MSGMRQLDVHRVDFGYFVRPAEETGSGSARVEAVLGYVVDHPGGVLLFDTGMGSHPDVDEHYRPSRVGVPEALRATGYRVDQVSHVANCHLHFDHCGGNPLLAGRPFYAQARELDEARTTSDYTLPELVDPDGVQWEPLDGAAEVLPGVTVLPTPGHTDGHQSLIVRRPDGVVIVAGQSHDTAHGFASDAMAVRARREGVDGPTPVPAGWMDAILAFDPAYVVFAHDHSVWMP